jgi:hypothetical protein
MIRVYAYISDYTGQPSQATRDIADIKDVASSRNPSLEITGALFFHNQQFVQIIEGPPSQIDELMIKISADPRHTHIKKLIDRPASNRGFSDWSMGTLNLSSSQKIDPDDFEKCLNLFSPKFDAQQLLSCAKSLMLMKSIQPLIL